ncbi:MAG: hypothetical protein ABL964_06320 [Steroidobacteraceae bacterium]
MSFNWSVRMTSLTAATVLGIAVLAGCQNESKPAAPAAAAESPYHVRTSIAEIMDSMVMPSADIIWKSTAVIESVEGTKDLTPKNDEDWKVVERAAVVMSEALNSLMIPGRRAAPEGAPVDDDGDELQPAQIEELIRKEPQVWIGFAQAIDGTVQKLQGAIKARDLQAISDLGGELDEVCENCHLQFWYPPKQEK